MNDDRHRQILARQGVVVTDLEPGRAGTRVVVPEGVEAALPVELFAGPAAIDTPPSRHTIITAGPRATVHCLEGCVAPIYTPARAREAVVEIHVGVEATVTFTSLQNWSHNVSSTVDRSATVQAGGVVEWIDVIVGAGQTQVTTTTDLAGSAASARMRSVVLASGGQHHRTITELVHRAPATRSDVEVAAVATGPGRITGDLRRSGDGDPSSAGDTAWRGLVLGPEARIEAGPAQDGIEISPIDPEAVFHLMSRGLSGPQAARVIVAGFTDRILRALPMAYGIEWRRVIDDF